MKKGTRWIYGSTYYDSTGAVTKSGAAYHDTTIIIGDTLAFNTRWFITSVDYTVNTYVLQAVGLRNGEYWKFLKGTCSTFDTISISPLFRNNLKKDESFETVYCLAAGTGREIRYTRIVIETNVPVSIDRNTYECMKVKETKITPDAYGAFEYQYYYYHSVYGLIRNEYFKKSNGGTVYRVSEKNLLSISLGQ